MPDNSKVLANKVVFLPDTVNCAPNAALFDGQAGFPTLAINTARGPVHLHSTFYPAKEAEVYWQNKLPSIEESDLVIFIGFGLGYHVEELLKQRPGAKIVVLEPHASVWELAVRNMNLSYLASARFFLALVGGDRDNVRFALLRVFSELHGHGAIKGIKVYVHPAFEQFVEGWSDLLQGVRMSISGFSGGLTTVLGTTEIWYNNSLTNLKFALRDPLLNNCPALFAGCPAVIIGAGPSLMENIDYLKQIYTEKSALLIAAGTAYPALVKHGINPHFLGTVDASELNWELINVRAYREFHRETILLYDIITHPWILRDFEGDRAWAYSSSSPWANIYAACWQTGEPISAAASVSTFLFVLALKLGCNPIVLVGNDYAYRNDGQRYASDTLADHKMERDPLHAGEWVLNYAGEKVFSPHDYSPARFFISQWAQSLRGVSIYNAAYRGAVIEGAPYKNLGELAVQFKKRAQKLDLDYVKSQIKTISPEPKDSMVLADKLLAEITRFENRLKSCRKGKNEKETLQLAEDILYDREGKLIVNKIWQIVHSFKINGVKLYLADKKQRMNFIYMCQLVLDKIKENIEDVIKDLLTTSSHTES
ncbi:motility associated factor glycosyltransferase family protein [Desulfotruncus alcoholivorax]|uniref:motility associated factor glycosyltransferase family protein n=1 Tax=Desulfotruncus alcoholivorax TaxID=265477 RepID=UPI0004113A27|nr:6-hydroxymethylpterin diphosphokinase MptE-like protein [Desulfotruncus alcoholivorax]